MAEIQSVCDIVQYADTPLCVSGFPSVRIQENFIYILKGLLSGLHCDFVRSQSLYYFHVIL